MNHIILISTVHEPMGKCNADELHKILQKIGPEVIFLEALADTYSDYQRTLHNSFGVYHKKLEIAAIQRYQEQKRIRYVAVLDNGLSDAFERKFKKLQNNIDHRSLVNEYVSLTERIGFQFLNSIDGMELQAKTRRLEKKLLYESELEASFNSDIDNYENTMIRNIHSYCSENAFHTGVFMCGSAHRNSLIQKIENDHNWEKVGVGWSVYGGKGVKD